MNLAAGRHGGDGQAIAAALGLDPASILDLSQSMNPAAPDVGQIVARHLDSVGHYPNPVDATDLLAQHLGVETKRLLLTNGGSEAITIASTELGGRVRSEPEFALHPRNSEGPIWRSDPHNPTGHLAGDDDHADVWDEAFYPLATGQWTAHRKGTVVGSLTKTFNCPGLRLGYLIADDQEADGAARFARHQPHWSIGSLALAALPDMLEACDLNSWQTTVAQARSDLAAIFEGRGFATESADAPWVLVTAPDLRNTLMPSGIIVRDCGNFGMADVVRVGITNDEGLNRLANALDHIDAP